MQTISIPENSESIVLNIDQVMKDKDDAKWYRFNKRSGSKRYSKSSSAPSIATSTASIATDRPVFTSQDVDDMSLELTDIKEEDARELNLDDIAEERSSDVQGDRVVDDLSVSDTSSAAFSFHSTPTAAAGGADYPALYNPEKQQEFESNKYREEMKTKYGSFFPIYMAMDTVQTNLCVYFTPTSTTKN